MSLPPVQSLAVPVRITNSQPAATPAPFQQYVFVTYGLLPAKVQQYVSPKCDNAVFAYDPQFTRLIPTWVFQCYTYGFGAYVLLTAGIPGNSTLTIYYAPVPSGIARVLGNGYTGMEASLAMSLGLPPYYDNGRQVFNAYINPVAMTSVFWPSPQDIPKVISAQVYASNQPLPSLVGTNPTSVQLLYYNPNISWLAYQGVPVVPTIVEWAWQHDGIGGAGALSLFGNPNQMTPIHNLMNTQLGPPCGLSPSSYATGAINVDFVYSTFTCYGNFGPWPGLSQGTGYQSSYAIVFTTMYPLMGNFYVYSYLLTDISAMKAVVGFQRTTYGLVSGSFPYPISTTLGRLWNTAATTNQAAFVSNTATLTVGVVSSNNYLIVGGGTGANSYQWLYWLIARSMPPGGVMPSVTIGY